MFYLIYKCLDENKFRSICMYSCLDGYDIKSGMLCVCVCIRFGIWKGIELKCIGILLFLIVVVYL